MQQIKKALENAMVTYCASNALSTNCLFLPDIIFAPSVATLIWSVFMVLTSLLLVQGAISGNVTAPLTAYIYMMTIFMCVQIGLGTMMLVTYQQFKSFVDKSLADSSPLGPSFAADLAYTVDELWQSPDVTDTEWKAQIGCQKHIGSSYSEGGGQCFVSQIRRVTLTLACTLLVPIVVQIPGVVLAAMLRTWVVEERGVDLFTKCRLPYGCTMCLMCSFLLVILFGVVVAALPA